jgi:hypothetical protein
LKFFIDFQSTGDGAANGRLPVLVRACFFLKNRLLSAYSTHQVKCDLQQFPLVARGWLSLVSPEIGGL